MRPDLDLIAITVHLVLLAIAVAFAAVWLSTTLSALAGWVLAPRRQRRVMETRLAEALLVGDAVQRWMRTPKGFGGRTDGEIATFDRIGLRADPLSPHVRRTENGRYRLLPVPGRRGATVVLAWGHGTADAVAILVVGALVQVQLPTIPWAWVRAQIHPPTAPAPAPASPPEPDGTPPLRRARKRPPPLPKRHRPPRAPSRRLPRRPAWLPRTDGDRAPPRLATRGSPSAPPDTVLASSHSPPIRPPCSPPAVLREPLPLTAWSGSRRLESRRGRLRPGWRCRPRPHRHGPGAGRRVPA